MKLLIGTVIVVAIGALVLGFWIAPGWMKGVVSHAFGWPSVQDRHDISHLKTMVMPDLKQHGADCAAIKDIEPKGKEGADTLLASITCTSGEVYELRMHEKSPWEYRRLR
jgi:hypothetical protein